MSESHTNRPHRDRLTSLLLAITAPLSEEELALAPRERIRAACSDAGLERYDALVAFQAEATRAPARPTPEEVPVADDPFALSPEQDVFLRISTVLEALNLQLTALRQSWSRQEHRLQDVQQQLLVIEASLRIRPTP